MFMIVLGGEGERGDWGGEGRLWICPKILSSVGIMLNPLTVLCCPVLQLTTSPCI